jgi:uncharacterized protein YkwD
MMKMGDVNQFYYGPIDLIENMKNQQISQSLRLFLAALAFIFILSILPSSGTPRAAAEELPPPILLDPPQAPERPRERMELNDTPVLMGSTCPTNQSCIFIPFITRNADDPRDRGYALRLYQTAYLGSNGLPAGWNGSIAGCAPGSTSQAFRDSVLLRVNYFREMAGVPRLTGLRPEYNGQDQAAALMMAANEDLNHTPPQSWKCYTQTGYDGASTSNLALGAYGPAAISLYMSDGGVASLGHRRWVLYPQTQEMGTGDVTGSTWRNQSNALKAWDSHIWDARPATRDAYVAWPPAAYVPYQVVYPVWSFSLANANFANASVIVSSNGTNIPLTVTRPDNGFGENTLAFKPCNCSSWPRPAADTNYQVTISNVVVGGVSRNYSYAVTIFDPGS